MKHFHFEIQAFQEKTHIPGKGRFAFEINDMAVVDVLAFTEKEAINKAKTILKRKHYRVGKVYECHRSEEDPQEERELRILQMEQMNRFLKKI